MKNIPLIHHLWFQLLLRISVVIGVIIFASFYYIIIHQKTALMEREKNFAGQISAAIEKTMYYGMELNDFTMVNQMIAEVSGKDSAINSIRIMDKKGRIIVSSHEGEAGQMIGKEDGHCNFCHRGTVPKSDKFAAIDESNTISVVNLLYNGPRCMVHHHSPSKKVLGALVIDMSKERVNEQIRHNLYDLVGSAVVTFLVMSLLTFLAITVLITCPIKNLMKVMIDATKGNLDARAETKSRNEIGLLTRTFNFMIERLKEMHETAVKKEHEIATMQEGLRYKAELETLNAELKNRVMELESANQQIETMVHDIEDKNYHLEKAIDRLRILYKISTTLTTVLDSNDVIKLVVDRSASIMKAKTASLMLLDSEKKELTIRYSIGLDPDIAANARIKLGDSVSGWVAREGKPLLVKNIETDERFGHINRANYETKSLISTPVVIKGEITGVLNVNNKLDGSDFTEDELQLLNTIASQMAISLENAKLYNDLQQSYFDTITAMVNAIEAKDTYTRGHSERVTQLAMKLGRALNLSPKRLENLQHAAVLHDIGKIGTDLGILHKIGMLNDEEFSQIKEHPTTGSQIIEPIGFLDDVKKIIEEHHERYDGKGYPLGKNGEELSLEARIIAIADSYDAMTSNRPYRTAMDRDFALAEIRKCAGTQFDPRLVELFIDLVGENE